MKEMSAIFKKGSLSILALAILVGSGCASAPKPAQIDKGAPKMTDLSIWESGDYLLTRIRSEKPIESSAFILPKPLRLTLEMNRMNIEKFTDPINLKTPLVSAARLDLFEATAATRLEFDLKREARYLIRSERPDEILLIVSPMGGPDPADYELEIKETELPFESLHGAAGPAEKDLSRAERERRRFTSDVTTKIVDVKYHQIGAMGRVIIETNKLKPEFRIIRRARRKRLTIDLPDALIERANEKKIDINRADSNIDNITAFQFTIGRRPTVKVVTQLEQMELYRAYAKDEAIYLDIGDEAALALASEAPTDDQIELRADEISAEERDYTGIPVSLDFQKADIQSILRILADVSRVNIITSESVGGTVTMKLRNVPWDQALDVILKNNGLDMVRQGGIIRVATVAEIQKEKEATERLLLADRKISPLVTQVVAINFEQAESVKNNLLTLKSERGTVDVNARTNSLIIKDTRARITEMIRLIEKLDKQEPQVQIESRIVEVATSNTNQLGIQWGGELAAQTSAIFPSTIGVSGGVRPGGPNQPFGGTIVDTASSIAATGGIGVTLGHVGGSALLDARLLAMESTGTLKIISKPKITTLNNQKALIESGRDVPYQSAADGGGTKTEFKKATLKLEVTPHITPNRLVRMRISAAKDEADFSTGGTNSPPSIVTKRADTEVIARDGDTVVLGGLFKNTENLGYSKVPFLANVPIIGWLFKGRTQKAESEELLIFITPKILAEDILLGE